MITEDRLNELVATFLADCGWVGVRALKGRQPGVDVLGAHPDGQRQVEVESKGGTSGHPTSKKFGKPFNSADVSVNVSEAVFAALSYRERSSHNTVLIALPDDAMNMERIAKVEGILRRLDIGLLAVSASGVRVVHGRIAPDDPPAFNLAAHAG